MNNFGRRWGEICICFYLYVRLIMIDLHVFSLLKNTDKRTALFINPYNFPKEYALCMMQKSNISISTNAHRSLYQCRGFRISWLTPSKRTNIIWIFLTLQGLQKLGRSRFSDKSDQSVLILNCVALLLFQSQFGTSFLVNCKLFSVNGNPFLDLSYISCGLMNF